ncbi:Cl- channel voltage-gated family protein [Pyrolobus fumarii 1A]|uniref:Cl-channel voltage-gated family protein n=1 Tax=Pyrolobus fumarii (strain DSM 11204 / 1A) TaxID=694429 RepID=G0EDS0_PYRF1|nr:chloride channel protein [Pyrolobus fumarii]AEM38689.1 Cl- channel voltage-gated family protein [Pyrolobus fumarii 1A]
MASSQRHTDAISASRGVCCTFILESLIEPLLIGLVVGLAAAVFGLLFSYYEEIGAAIRVLLGDYWLFTSIALFSVVGLALVKLYGWYEGSSTNKFLEYYHFDGGRIPGIAALVLVVGSLITVAAGGSVGPEGPTLILGGYIGYIMARKLLNKPAYEAKEHVLIGAGAAVAAVFKAPLTAMTFVLEVLYRRDLETGVFLETLVATVTAYLVSVALTGPAGIMAVRFGGSPIPTLEDIIAGLVAGLAASIVARIMVESKHLLSKLSREIVKVSKLAGPLLLTSIIWLASRRHPFVLGGGEHIAVEALHNELELAHTEALWASVEKAVLTTASLTLGGTGGIFLPLVTIGSLLGYGLSGLLPEASLNVLILASIAGVFAGTNSVVISAVLFGVEVLGGHAFIPSALAATLAYLLSMGTSIHSNQLPRREVAKKLALASLLHRLVEHHELRKRLETLSVLEAANKNPIKFTAEMSVGDALRIAAEKSHIAYPVVDTNGILLGYVELEDMIAVDPTTKLRELVRPAPVISPDASILQASLAMIRRDVDRLFVCDKTGYLLGILTKTDLLRTLMQIYEEVLEQEFEEVFE